jgi:hypothetical protein
VRWQTDRAATHDGIGLQSFEVELEISRSTGTSTQTTLGHRAVVIVHGVGVHVSGLALGTYAVGAFVDAGVPTFLPVPLLPGLVESQLLLVAAAEAGELEGDLAGAGVAALGGDVIIVVFVFVFVIVIFVVSVGLVVIIIVVFIVFVVFVIFRLARWLFRALWVYQFGVRDGVGCFVVGEFDDFNVILDQDFDDLPHGTGGLEGMDGARS